MSNGGLLAGGIILGIIAIVAYILILVWLQKYPDAVTKWYYWLVVVGEVIVLILSIILLVWSAFGYRTNSNRWDYFEAKKAAEAGNILSAYNTELGQPGVLSRQLTDIRTKGSGLLTAAGASFPGGKSGNVVSVPVDTSQIPPTLVQTSSGDIVAVPQVTRNNSRFAQEFRARQAQNAALALTTVPPS